MRKTDTVAVKSVTCFKVIAESEFPLPEYWWKSLEVSEVTCFEIATGNCVGKTSGKGNGK